MGGFSDVVILAIVMKTSELVLFGIMHCKISSKAAKAALDCMTGLRRSYTGGALSSSLE